MNNQSSLSGITKIFNKYRKKVYGLALSISRNEKDAEDIVQNTFIKVMNKIKGFRNHSLVSTWIYRIAYNEALMYLRKKRRFLNMVNSMGYYNKRAPSGMFINWARLPDEQLLDKELKERMDDALKRMPIQYRLPLLLQNENDLSVKEGSLVMGIKENSFKTRVHRAHLMVRKEIADYFDDKKEPEQIQEEKCNIWTGFAYRYASGKLPKKRGSAFKKHIGDCPGCKSFLDTYSKAISITKALECRDLPVELKAKIKDFMLKTG